MQTLSVSLSLLKPNLGWTNHGLTSWLPSRAGPLAVSWERVARSLLTERQDGDGDVLWPFALLVNEVPCHSLLPLCHPAVVLAAVLKAEAIDLQYKNVIAFFGYLELAQSLTLGKFVVKHWHSVWPQTGDERAVEGPGDGEVAVRDVLCLQDAPKLHRLAHNVHPLLRLQPDAELLIWGETEQLKSAWQSQPGEPAHLMLGSCNLLHSCDTSTHNMEGQVACFSCERQLATQHPKAARPPQPKCLFSSTPSWEQLCCRARIQWHRGMCSGAWFYLYPAHQLSWGQKARPLGDIKEGKPLIQVFRSSAGTCAAGCGRILTCKCTSGNTETFYFLLCHSYPLTSQNSHCLC